MNKLWPGQAQFMTILSFDLVISKKNQIGFVFCSLQLDSELWHESNPARTKVMK